MATTKKTSGRKSSAGTAKKRARRGRQEEVRRQER